MIYIHFFNDVYLNIGFIIINKAITVKKSKNVSRNSEICE